MSFFFFRTIKLVHQNDYKNLKGFFVWFSFSFQILISNLQFAHKYNMHIHNQRRENTHFKTQNKNLKINILAKYTTKNVYTFTQYLFATLKTLKIYMYCR